MTEPAKRSAKRPDNDVATPGLSVQSFLSLFFSQQFLKFLLAGGVAALTHWYARYALTPALGYVSALVVAYAVGIAVGYILNAWLVFSNAKTTRAKQMRYFVLFNLAMAPIVILLSYFLSEFAFSSSRMTYHPREIAHALAVTSPIFINFLFHKFFTFRGG